MKSKFDYDHNDDSSIPTTELLNKIDTDLKHLQGQRKILERAREGKTWKLRYCKEKTNNICKKKSPVKCSTRCKINDGCLYNVLQKIRYIKVADSCTQIGSSLTKMNQNEHKKSNIDQIDHLNFDNASPDKIQPDTYRKHSKRKLNQTNRALRLKKFCLENKKRTNKVMDGDIRTTRNYRKYKETEEPMAAYVSSGSSLSKSSSIIRRHAKLEREILEYAREKEKNEIHKRRSKDLYTKPKNPIRPTDVVYKEPEPEVTKSRLLKKKTNGKQNISIYNHDTFIIVDSHKKKSHHPNNDSTKLDPNSKKSEKNDLSSAGSNIIDDSTYVLPKNSEENNFLIFPYTPNISVNNTLSPSEEIIAESLGKSSQPLRPSILEQHVTPQQKNREKLLDRFNKNKSKKLDSTWDSHGNNKRSQNNSGVQTPESSHNQTQRISLKGQSIQSPGSFQTNSGYNKGQPHPLENKQRSLDRPSQQLKSSGPSEEPKDIIIESVTEFLNFNQSEQPGSTNVQTQNQPFETNPNEIFLKGIIDSETGTSVIWQSWSNNRLQAVSIPSPNESSQIPAKTSDVREKEESWGNIFGRTSQSPPPIQQQEKRTSVQYETQPNLNVFGVTGSISNTYESVQIPAKTSEPREIEGSWGNIFGRTSQSPPPVQSQETRTSVQYETQPNLNVFGVTGSISNTYESVQIPAKTSEPREIEGSWGNIFGRTSQSPPPVQSQETRTSVQYETQPSLNLFGVTDSIPNTYEGVQIPAKTSDPREIEESLGNIFGRTFQSPTPIQSQETRTSVQYETQPSLNLFGARLSKNISRETQTQEINLPQQDLIWKSRVIGRSCEPSNNQFLDDSKSGQFSCLSEKEDEINLKIFDCPKNEPSSTSNICKLLTDPKICGNIFQKSRFSDNPAFSSTSKFAPLSQSDLFKNFPIESDQDFICSSKDPVTLYYRDEKTSGNLFVNKESEHDGSYIRGLSASQPQNSDMFSRKSAITVVFKEAMEKLTPKSHRSIKCSELGAIPKLNTSSCLKNISVCINEKFEKSRNNRSKSVNFSDKCRSLPVKDASIRPHSIYQLSTENTKSENDKKTELKHFAKFQISKPLTFAEEPNKTKTPSDTQYLGIFSKDYEKKNSSFEKSLSKLRQNSNLIAEPFEGFCHRKTFSTKRETKPSIPNDSDTSDGSSRSKFHLISPQSLERNFRMNQNKDFCLEKRSSPNLADCSTDERRLSFACQFSENNMKNSVDEISFHTIDNKEHEDDEEFIDCESNGENHCLSEKLVHEDPVEGVTLDISDFIHHLEHRVRDCDERFKMQTKQLEKVKNQCSLKGEERKSEHDLQRECSYYSIAEMKKSSESLFEEIPPFHGCDCMRKDYYEIMKIAYRKW